MAPRWCEERGGRASCFGAAWPSLAGEKSAPAPFPCPWQPADGRSPSLSQNVLQGETKARRFLRSYQGFMFHVRTALPCLLRQRTAGPLLAPKSLFGTCWKLTLLSCLSVLLLRPAVHAEEGPAEPHDKAAWRAKAPCGKGAGGRQWAFVRELACAQAWPKEWPLSSCLALFSKAGKLQSCWK